MTARKRARRRRMLPELTRREVRQLRAEHEAMLREIGELRAFVKQTDFNLCARIGEIHQLLRPWLDVLEAVALQKDASE